jgi:hypothetical protein
MFAHLALVACKALELIDKATDDEAKLRRLVIIIGVLALVVIACNSAGVGLDGLWSLARDAGAWAAQIATAQASGSP